MSKKVATQNGLIIAENTEREMRESNIEQYSVFTKDEWSQPRGFKYAEMDFSSIEHAREWCRCY